MAQTSLAMRIRHDLVRPMAADQLGVPRGGPVAVMCTCRRRSSCKRMVPTPPAAPMIATRWPAARQAAPFDGDGGQSRHRQRRRAGAVQIVRQSAQPWSRRDHAKSRQRAKAGRHRDRTGRQFGSSTPGPHATISPLRSAAGVKGNCSGIICANSPRSSLTSSGLSATWLTRSNTMPCPGTGTDTVRMTMAPGKPYASATQAAWRGIARPLFGPALELRDDGVDVGIGSQRALAEAPAVASPDQLVTKYGSACHPRLLAVEYGEIAQRGALLPETDLVVGDHVALVLGKGRQHIVERLAQLCGPARLPPEALQPPSLANTARNDGLSSAVRRGIVEIGAQLDDFRAIESIRDALAFLRGRRHRWGAARHIPADNSRPSAWACSCMVHSFAW